MNQDKQIITVEAVKEKINHFFLFTETEYDIHNKDLFRLLEIFDKFQNPPSTKCTCEKTGETEMLVMCCNICGKPDEGAVGRMGESAIKLPSEEEIAETIELKKYQLHYEDSAFAEGANYIINYIKQQSK